LTEVDNATFFDEDGLAREDVDDVREAKLPQGDGFRGKEVVLCSLQCL
jgi:hypothetical protein